MYETKKYIYLYLTRNQKSALCSYIKALVKKSINLNPLDILNKFLEDELYYLKINNSRFPFLSEYLENELFLSDTEKYINVCKKYYEMREAQKPIILANKEFEKKKRKFLQEVKMSKEPPTKKQIYYYEKLCKKYNIDKIKLTSKLMARDEIDKIIAEHEKDYYTNLEN